MRTRIGGCPSPARQAASAPGIRAARTLPALILAIAALLPSPSAAQTVVGMVVEAETGHPVVGAMVVLVDEDGEEHGQGLTNQEGRYTVEAPSSGRYAVRARRIGRRTVTSGFLELEDGARLERTLESPAEVLGLEGLTAEGEDQCRLHPAEGEEMARLWEEARQALELEARSREREAYRYQLRNHTRQLDPDDGRVLSEQSHPVGGYMEQPYESLPVDELLEGGWVRDEGGGATPEWVAYAPDGAALLSDAFMDAHCFGVRREADREGLVGLSFEPVEDPREPGLRGVLWLDEATAELRLLSFRFTHLPSSQLRNAPIPGDALGGELEFMGLPDGSWVVSRWALRLPVLAIRDQQWQDDRQERIVVAEVRETGGQVLEVRRPDGETVARPSGTRVTGTVRDARGEPLAGAVAYLEGTAYEANTDPSGEFDLTGLPEGIFHLSFRHPSLSAWGAAPDPVSVDLEADAEVDVELTAPNPEGVIAEACPSAEAGDGDRGDPGLVVGRITDSETGEALAGIQVRLEDRRVVWRGRGGPGAVAEEWAGASARTGERGRYRVCALPAGPWGEEGRFTLTLLAEGVELRSVPVGPSEGEILELDLEVRP